MKVGPVIILVLFTFNISRSQTRHGNSGSSAQSSLTVTATVDPSVWLVMEPDGTRDVVVANAPDPKESFYYAPVKGRRKGTAVAVAKQTAIRKEQMRNQDDGAVRFTFPTSKQFDVSKKTVMMDVSAGGKTERRPVMVTTVVPQ
jgi:hypothetical protein